MHAYPMKLEPILMQRVWGGRRLAEMFAKTLPDDQPYGESWEVSDVSEHASKIANGPLAGRTLRELMVEDAAALLGDAAPAEGGRFPLLVKLLDCRERLSVQVHPDEAACRILGGGARPKTESWIVLHADPGAKIYLGVKPGVTRDAFAAAIENGIVGELLNVIEPKTGDCFYIPSGTVHAIGGGLVIAEIQQTSDTTYRVYDWGRVGLEGKPRPLHVEQALASIHFGDAEPPTAESPVPIDGGDGDMGAVLLAESYAWIARVEAEGGFDFRPGGVATIAQCIAGTAEVADGDEWIQISTGDCVLLPADLETARVEPGADGIKLLISKPE